MGKEINLAYLYPDILNLHGDRGNILAFKKIAQEMNITLNITRIDSPNDKIDFDNFDIIILSPGELKAMDILVEAFSKQKDDFNRYIENNKYMFVFGTTIAFLCNEITRENGDVKKGLNIFNISGKERSFIYGDDLVFNTKINNKEMEIVSCQINAININFNDESVAPFGHVTYGMGNNTTENEGARKNNLICTNALGPMFIKNPWIVKEVLLDIATKKGIENINEDTNFSLEEYSKKTIKSFISNKEAVTIK